MLEPTSGADLATLARVRSSLQELAQLMRTAHHLRPEVQQAIADLIDELAGTLEAGQTSAQAAHLAEATTQVVRLLHERPHEGLLTTARERLEAAAAQAEAKAPVATGIARRLIDVLAEIGI